MGVPRKDKGADKAAFRVMSPRGPASNAARIEARVGTLSEAIVA